MESPSGFYGLHAGAPPGPGGRRLVPLGDVEYRTPAELAANAGRVLTCEQLLQQVWGAAGDGDGRPLRTALSKIRLRLSDDPDNPTYIINESRVGDRTAGGREGAD